jgi:hypothetical protein
VAAVNEVIAAMVAWGVGGLAVLIVVALILLPSGDKPYVGEDGVLVPCGCGCGDTP